LTVIGLLAGESPRLGYSFTSAVPATYVAYAESALPEDRKSAVPADSAFSGLHNAVYLGDREDAEQLLTASTADLPLGGRRASEVVVFGDSSLLLVMSPSEELGGQLLATLPWIVLGVGIVATVASAFLVDRLLRRRDDAARLAEDNGRLYANERSVAQTLQQSLLPERLSQLPGVELAFRYEPGADDVEIGGDWYDVIPLGDGRLMMVLGDVSGRGLRAGTVMASLRFGARAFASQGDTPAMLLAKLCALLDLDHDGHFATVVCAVADVDSRTLTVASAGHPNPLLVSGTTVDTIDVPIGVPIGVSRDARYESVTVSLPAGATVLAFTDGLFERRGETVEDGLARLRRNVSTAGGSLEDLLTQIMVAQACADLHDDTAILAIRWQPTMQPA